MYVIKLICFSLICVTGSTVPLSAASEAALSNSQPRSKRSDDGSVQELRALIEQQAALIQQQSATNQQQSAEIQQQSADIKTLQAKVTALENQVKKQVAFSVSLTEDTHAVNIAQNSPIKFTHVTTNTGNAYHRDTGIFTAPSAGLYAFFLAVREDPHTNDYVYVGVVKSPGQVTLCRTAVEGTNNARWDKGTCLATVHLRQGDQVHAQRVGGQLTIDKGWPTSFSGMLVSADL